MNLKLTIKETEIVTRSLSVYEEALWRVTLGTSNDDYYERLVERCHAKLAELGLTDIKRSEGNSPFGKITIVKSRPATPEEIVAWNIFNISLLCGSDKIGCRTCPLNLLYDDSDRSCCEVDKRTAKALKILTGKEMVITTE